jgi:two-component system, cell cycle sensor histidine kinase and response regulator CckA
MLTNLLPADQKKKAHSDAVIDDLCADARERRKQLDLPLSSHVGPSNEQKAHHEINNTSSDPEQERERLREDLERLDLALKSANMGVWYVDIINDRRIFSEQSCRLLGLDPSTFDGSRSAFMNVVHPDDRVYIGSLLAKTIENGVPYESEYRVIWPDGCIHYITGRGKVVRDEAGNPLKIHGIHWDITERKRAERAMAESEERFRRLVRNSNDVAILMDENGIQTFISGPLEKMLGYKLEEFTNTGLRFDLVHPDDVENVQKAFAECIQQPGSVRTIEYRGLHKNGKWITIEAIASNLLNDPVVKAAVINVRDISERNRLREELQQAMKMEAIGRLAGGIAHDFNNILTVISGNIELAGMGMNPSDPLMGYLNQTMKASDSAASLIRQLLAFSRKQIIEPRALNLNDLVRNVRQMLARLIDENIELGVVLSEGVGSVRIDPGRFEQVLVNLAVNARDAMPDGGKIMIETANITFDGSYCATHPQVRPGNFVMLCVSDTGQGMSEEVKEHIFEPFFTTKDRGHGSGLGLATTFGVVKQAGGMIEVCSEAGHGTTFRIYLPLTEEKAERLVRERRSIAGLKGNETILLVEDEKGVRQVGMRMLDELGYHVLEARNGEEALMLAEKHIGQIDLLLTDIVMPGINGRELSERLTERHPEMKTLFSSGYTEDVIVHHGVAGSALNFIGKPYSMQSLAGKIRNVLGTEKNCPLMTG